MQAILKHPGAKWNLATWIVQHMPPHAHYIEPFAGSAAVFFHKKPSPHEVINDLDGRIVNFFRVCRDHADDLARLIAFTPWSRAEYDASYEQADDPLEDARRYMVRAWQAHGFLTHIKTGWRNNGVKSLQPITTRWKNLPHVILWVSERLQDAEIECKPALDVIVRYNAPDALLYVDPPYVLSTRNHRPMYKHEMTDEQHSMLLSALQQHTGPVLLSGYDSALYRAYLQGWRCVTTTTQAEKGGARIEVLWLNHAAVPLQVPLF